MHIAQKLLLDIKHIYMKIVGFRDGTGKLEMAAHAAMKKLERIRDSISWADSPLEREPFHSCKN